MFDIGASEIFVIGVVALIVIGPERLPRVAKTVGHLFGRFQWYVSEVKSDINREIELEELKKLQQEVRSAATEIETSVTAVARDVETGVRGVETDLNCGSLGVTGGRRRARRRRQRGAPADRNASGAVRSARPARQASLPGFDRG